MTDKGSPAQREQQNITEMLNLIETEKYAVLREGSPAPEPVAYRASYKFHGQVMFALFSERREAVGYIAGKTGGAPYSEPLVQPLFMREAPPPATKGSTLTQQLAECYRLTGADPDGNEDWRLAPYAVTEVRDLRQRFEETEDDLTALRASVEAVTQEMREGMRLAELAYGSDKTRWPTVPQMVIRWAEALDAAYRGEH